MNYNTSFLDGFSDAYCSVLRFGEKDSAVPISGNGSLVQRWNEENHGLKVAFIKEEKK